MSLKEYNFRKEYRTNTSNLVREFYIPALSRAKVYKRAVGFFSSTALIQIIEGIKQIVEIRGRIEMIVSPKLSEEDIDAIEKGYKLKDEVIVSSLLQSLEEFSSIEDKKRLAVLTELIIRDVLDIRVAFLSKDKTIGMYHEKVGIVIDNAGDYLSFSGSLNESETAYRHNIESIDVFRSWGSEDERERAQSKHNTFDNMWKDNDPGLEVIKFPDVALEKLQRIHRDFSLVTENEIERVSQDLDNLKEEYHEDNEKGPVIPADLNVRDYQSTAIENWRFNGYTGIFDMATGTGKTITALLAVTHLYKMQKRLAVIIVAPFTHLVEQWIDDLKWFKVVPIVGYSDPKYMNYKLRLANEVDDFNRGIIDFMCFITTNASFRLEDVQEIVSDFPKDTLIIVDEAHNFGSKRLLVSLPLFAKYRLALSATIDRHNDVEGTRAIYEYFGGKSIEYSLERAIDERMLTKYQYHPILTVLEPDEFSEYKRLTSEVAKYLRVVNGVSKLSDAGKMILLKRARIISGAKNKIVKLLDIIGNYKKESNFLVYCGATNMIDESLDDSEIRQIDYISKVLYELYNIRTSQFTSKESREDRNNIIQGFVNQEIQGIVAIKCLDEGLNIPSIKTAFILASSTNPKEYIQRRGRVLRLYPNKEFSVIYDFVVVPREVNEARLLTDQEKTSDLGLVKRELKRVYEFSKLSMNSDEGMWLIGELMQAYSQIRWDDVTTPKEDQIDG